MQLVGFGSFHVILDVHESRLEVFIEVSIEPCLAFLDG